MKRMIALLMIMLFASAVLASPTSAEIEPAFLMGDVDFNGTVNAVDALEALRWTVGYYPPLHLDEQEVLSQEMKVAIYYRAAFNVCGDVDNDGYVSAEDALYILKYTVGKIKEFPVTDITRAVNYDQLSAWPGDVQ